MSDLTVEAESLVTRGAVDAVTVLPEGRTIDLRLVRWGEVSDQTNEGYQETFARGAFAGTEPSRVVLESQRHQGDVVGVATAILERDDGAYASFRVAGTPAGDELLTLAREGILTDASVVFAPRRARRLPGGVIERQSVDLRRVAILPLGAYPSAKVLAVRSAAEEEPTVNDTATAVDLSPVTSAIDALATRVGAIETLSQVPAAQEAPLIMRHASYGEYIRAAYNDASMELSRALADNLTSENPGLMQSHWLSDIKKIVSLGRRAIEAMGGPEAAGEQGLKVEWPQLNTAMTGLIGVQTTEKTEVTTADVSFTAGSATLKTYAGGSDIAIQLIERSSPSYLDAYMRVMTAAWSNVTDAAFAAELLAGGTGLASYRSAYGAAIAGTSTAAAADDIFRATAHGLAIGDAITVLTKTGGTGVTLGQVYWIIGANFASGTFQVSATPGGASIDITVDMTAYTFAKLTDATGLRLRSALFEASVAVENATGTPAQAVIASTDMFLAMAGMSGIVPPTPANNPSNASGTGLASTLEINVSGLRVVRAPGLAAGTVLVSNPAAARWIEDGPKTLTAPEVAKLGVDKAIYSYGITALYVPAGIVKISAV